MDEVTTLETLLKAILGGSLDWATPGSGALAELITPWLKGKLPGIGANDPVWDSIITSDKSAYGTYMSRLQDTASSAARTAISPQMDQGRQQFMSMVQRTLVSEETFNANQAKARLKVENDWEKTKEGQKAKKDFDTSQTVTDLNTKIKDRDSEEYKTEYQKLWSAHRRALTEDLWNRENPYKGMTYDQYTAHKTQGLSNNGLAKFLYRTMDPADTIKMGAQLEGVYSNIAGQGYTMGDRDAFAKAQYVTRNLFSKDGRFNYNRQDFGGMDKVGAAYLAKEISKAADTMDGVDSSSNTEQLKSATERLRQRVQEYARALEPLKDVFGKDVPAMLKAVEAVSGQTIATMGVQRARQLAVDIADRNQRGLYTTNDLAANTNVTLQMMDRMGAPIGNKIYAVDQTMRMLDMSRGKFQANWMTKADSDRAVTGFVLRSENSKAEDAIAAAYSIWKQKETVKGNADVSQATFNRLLAEKTAKTENGNIVGAAMGLAGVQYAQQLEEGKYYSGYGEAKQSRMAGSMVMAKNAEDEMRLMRRNLGTNLTMRNAMKSLGYNTDNLTPGDMISKMETMQKLMLANPELANMSMQERKAALTRMKNSGKTTYTDVYGNDQELDVANALNGETDVSMMASLIEGAKNIMPEKLNLLGKFVNLAQQNKASKVAATRRAAISEMNIAFPSSGAELLEDLLKGKGKGFSMEATTKMLGQISAMQLNGLTAEDQQEARALTTSVAMAMQDNVVSRIRDKDALEVDAAKRRVLASKWLTEKRLKPDAKLAEAQVTELSRYIESSMKNSDKIDYSSDKIYQEYVKTGKDEFSRAVYAEEQEKAKSSLIYSMTDPRALSDANYRKKVEDIKKLYKKSSYVTSNTVGISEAREAYETELKKEDTLKRTVAQTDNDLRAAQSRVEQLREKEKTHPLTETENKQKSEAEGRVAQLTKTKEQQLKGLKKAKKDRVVAEARYQQAASGGTFQEWERVLTEEQKAADAVQEVEKAAATAKTPEEKARANEIIKSANDRLKKARQEKIRLGDRKRDEAIAGNLEIREMLADQASSLLAMQSANTEAFNRHITEVDTEAAKEDNGVSTTNFDKSLFKRTAAGTYVDNSDTAKKKRRSIHTNNADDARNIIREAKGVINKDTLKKLEALGFDKVALEDLGYKVQAQDITEKSSDAEKAKARQDATLNMANAQLSKAGSLFRQGGAAAVTTQMTKEAIALEIKAQTSSKGLSADAAKKQKELFKEFYSWAQKSNEGIDDVALNKFLTQNKTSYDANQRAVASTIFNSAKQGVSTRGGQPTDISGLVGGIKDLMNRLVAAVETIRDDTKPKVNGTGNGANTKSSSQTGGAVN